MIQPRLEVAEVFREFIPAFLQRYGDTISPDQRRVLWDVARCRTAELGGHIEECDRCGHRRHAYNSCRNRHCPKCQAATRAQWLEERSAELLPVEYYHVVFTLPHEIGPLALQNQRQIYAMLFEFIRRFLLQVVPSGFMRIRHFGFLAHGHRAQKLELCRRLLNVEQAPDAEPAIDQSTTEEAVDLCPACKEGRMVIIENFERQRTKAATPAAEPLPLTTDTS